jgi:hypothetical protein
MRSGHSVTSRQLSASRPAGKSHQKATGRATGWLNGVARSEELVRLSVPLQHDIRCL